MGEEEEEEGEKEQEKEEEEEEEGQKMADSANGQASARNSRQTRNSRMVSWLFQSRSFPQPGGLTSGGEGGYN